MPRSNFNDKEREFLSKRITATVTVNQSNGLSHITPVWIIEHKNKLYSQIFLN